MPTPKISIIVPVYKAEKYLNRCVDSLLTQTFTDFEVLLIDDGSPDCSGKICDEYLRKDQRIRVFHQANKGVSATRKYGCRQAIGDYVALVDSDDSLPMEALSLLYGKALSLGLDVVMGSSNDICGGLEKINANQVEGILSSVEYVKALLGKLCIIGPACKIFRRSCLDEFTFSLPKEICLNEDLYMNICIAMHSKKIGIFNNIIAYNYTADNLNSVSHTKRMDEKGWIYLFCAIREQLEMVDGFFKECFSEYCNYIYRCIGENFCNNNIRFEDQSFIKDLQQISNPCIVKGKNRIYQMLIKHSFLIKPYNLFRFTLKRFMNK